MKRSCRPYRKTKESRLLSTLAFVVYLAEPSLGRLEEKGLPRQSPEMPTALCFGASQRDDWVVAALSRFAASVVGLHGLLLDRLDRVGSSLLLDRVGFDSVLLHKGIIKA